MNKVILISSSQGKIKEFKEFVPHLEIQTGKDLPEVLGTMDEVIIYKSLLAGKDYLVEDTIVSIANEEIVDIKWKKDHLEANKSIVWTVSLGYNDGEFINVFRAEVSGTTILDRKNNEAFGFDDIFIPLGLDKTLFELGSDKGIYSARKKALDNFVSNNLLYKVKIDSIPVWNGSYQNS